MSVLLRVDGLTVEYGPVRALDGVSIEVAAGAVTSVVGANGAGKSSLLRAISGLVPTKRGAVEFCGRDITGLPPHKVARRGIAHVPEGRHVIAPLTVEENLGLAAAFGRSGGSKRARYLYDQVYDIFPPLAHLRTRVSGSLSGGEQQMVAIGRALMAQPSCILLDEPSMGLAPVMVRAVYRILLNRPAVLGDTAILLAEQSAALALEVADHGYILANGRVVSDRSGAELRSEDLTLDHYLGSAVQRPAP